jgi:hypothetical protein
MPATSHIATTDSQTVRHAPIPWSPVPNSSWTPSDPRITTAEAANSSRKIRLREYSRATVGYGSGEASPSVAAPHRGQVRQSPSTSTAQDPQRLIRLLPRARHRPRPP